MALPGLDEIKKKQPVELEIEPEFTDIDDSDFTQISEDVDTFSIEEIPNDEEGIDDKELYEYEEEDESPEESEGNEDETYEDDSKPIIPLLGKGKNKKEKKKKEKPKKEKQKKKAKPKKEKGNSKLDLSFLDEYIEFFKGIPQKSIIIAGSVITAILVIIAGLLFMNRLNNAKAKNEGTVVDSVVKINVDYPNATVTSNERVSGYIQILYKRPDNNKNVVCETSSDDFDDKGKTVEFGCYNLGSDESIENYKLTESIFISD